MLTRDDLRTGMLVETRDKERYIVLADYETDFYGKGILISPNKPIFIPLRDYNGNFFSFEKKEFDIMRIWDTANPAYTLEDNTAHRTLIYERKSVKKTSKKETNYDHWKDLIIKELLCSSNFYGPHKEFCETTGCLDTILFTRQMKDWLNAEYIPKTKEEGLKSQRLDF